MTRRAHGARTCCKPTWTSSSAKSAHSPSRAPFHPLLSILPDHALHACLLSQNSAVLAASLGPQLGEAQPCARHEGGALASSLPLISLVCVLGLLDVVIPYHCRPNGDEHGNGGKIIASIRMHAQELWAI